MKRTVRNPEAAKRLSLIPMSSESYPALNLPQASEKRGMTSRSLPSGISPSGSTHNLLIPSGNTASLSSASKCGGDKEIEKHLRISDAGSKPNCNYD